MAMPDVIYVWTTARDDERVCYSPGKDTREYFSAAAVERMLREAFDTYCESVCVDHTEAIKHLMREQREGGE